MNKDIALNVIDNMIFVVRKNFDRFDDDFDEISNQLYMIEKMRLARLKDKYILRSLIENESILIQSIEKLNDKHLAREVNKQIKDIKSHLI